MPQIPIKHVYLLAQNSELIMSRFNKGWMFWERPYQNKIPYFSPLSHCYTYMQDVLPQGVFDTLLPQICECEKEKIHSVQEGERYLGTDVLLLAGL